MNTRLHRSVIVLISPFEQVAQVVDIVYNTHLNLAVRAVIIIGKRQFLQLGKMSVRS